LNKGESLREPATEHKRKLQEYNDRLQKKLLQIEPKEMSSDPFRLLKVGDASPSSEKIITRICYQINRKKVPGNSQLKEGISTFLQVIEAMSCGAFECELTEWQRPDSNAVGDCLKGKIPKKDLTLNDVIDACNEFYLAQFKQESELLHSNGYLNEQWYKTVNALLNRYQALFKQRRAMLLRVGKHCGAESVTLDGVRMIKVNAGKNKQPKILEHSTTVWLAGDHARAVSGMLPFGWVLIEFGANEASDELARVCEEFQSEIRAEYSKITEKLRGYRKQLEEQQAKLRQQEAEEQQRIREQQERQAKLAQMTEEQRKIVELTDLYQTEKEAGRLVAGCVVVNQLAELIKTATAEWQKEDRVALEQVARQIYQHTGQLKNKKFKQRLQELVKD
jgi:CRISPR-associated protein Csm5